MLGWGVTGGMGRSPLAARVLAEAEWDSISSRLAPDELPIVLWGMRRFHEGVMGDLGAGNGA